MATIAIESVSREQAVQVLELMATRMQWSMARSIISSTSLHTSRGWKETIASAKEAAYSTAIWSSAYEPVRNFVCEA